MKPETMTAAQANNRLHEIRARVLLRQPELDAARRNRAVENIWRRECGHDPLPAVDVIEDVQPVKKTHRAHQRNPNGGRSGKAN